MATIPRRALFLAALLTCFSFSNLFAQCTSGRVCNCPKCAIVSESDDGRWHIVETHNFRIRCDPSGERAHSLAKHAEFLRASLRKELLGSTQAFHWEPKCELVLHAELSSYVSAVGRGSEKTVGSSITKVESGRILSRRIDLLGAKVDFLTASLPHELTHVVLSDQFIDQPLPRWADEGLAILSDPDAKQGRHEKDLQQGLRNRTVFQIAGLLTLDDYPSPSRVGVFYGQSASLTAYLVKQKSSQEFVRFLQRSSSVGYDAALRTSYDIESVAELDRQWRKFLSDRAQKVARN